MHHHRHLNLCWSVCRVAFRRKKESHRADTCVYVISHGLSFSFAATWCLIWCKHLTTYACKTCPFCRYVRCVYPRVFYIVAYNVNLRIVVTEKLNSNYLYNGKVMQRKLARRFQWQMDAIKSTQMVIASNYKKSPSMITFFLK